MVKHIDTMTYNECPYEIRTVDGYYFSTPLGDNENIPAYQYLELCKLSKFAETSILIISRKYMRKYTER